jgi:hypothetical protein
LTGESAAAATRSDDALYRELEHLLLQQIALASAGARSAPVAGRGRRAGDGAGAEDPPRCIGLSASAVLDAQRLELATAARTRSFLYRYNTAPAGLVWRRELGTPERLRAYLFGSLRVASLDYASNRDEDEPSQGWWYWQREARRQRGANRLIHKLYISPTCEFTGLAFRAALEILFSHEVSSFKIGCSAHGLLRPDKFVVYFEELDRLLDLTEALAKRLQGVAAQSVPFTIPLTPDGLLSRGIDPPKPKSVGRPWSWRALVTARIAKWLHQGGAGMRAGDARQPISSSKVGSEHANCSE